MTLCPAKWTRRAHDVYTLTVTRSNVLPGTREPWILTCETPPSGTVLQRAEVIVERGQTAAKLDLRLCAKSG